MIDSSHKKPLSFANYFLVSWFGIIFIPVLLALSADVVSAWVALVGCFLSAWCFLPRESERLLKLRPRLSLLLLFLVLSIFDGIYQFKLTEDIIYIIDSVMFGLLPLCLLYRHKVFWYWVALIDASLIALSCVIV